jgi:hypothetical protein
MRGGNLLSLEGEGGIHLSRRLCSPSPKVGRRGRGMRAGSYRRQDVKQSETQDGAVIARLAVIESKVETVISELTVIRECVPGKIIEHTERITALERGMRGLQWIAGVFAVAIIGAFVGHIFGR